MPQWILKAPASVSNDKDNMSCMHACTQMVMHTRPNSRVFTFDEINKILRRKSGMYSWGYAISDAVSKEGFAVKGISTFSTERFVNEKEAYLLERFGQEGGQTQIKYTDMPVVVEDAQKFLKNENIERETRVPTLDDIRDHITNGWYIVPNVNYRALNVTSGYQGHFIFIYGFDDEGIIYHDPGLPAKHAQKTAWRIFDHAWSYPNEDARVMTCYKPIV